MYIQRFCQQAAAEQESNKGEYFWNMYNDCMQSIEQEPSLEKREDIWKQYEDIDLAFEVELRKHKDIEVNQEVQRIQQNGEDVARDDDGDDDER